jgi:hypothetical protein
MLLFQNLLNADDNVRMFRRQIICFSHVLCQVIKFNDRVALVKVAADAEAGDGGYLPGVWLRLSTASTSRK